jgi:tetraacyldisaccharide 4'-kinase
VRAPAFWTIRHGRDAAPMLRLLLSPLGWIYGISVARRLARTTPVRLPIPVVSIGNISVGGTGKTPLALMIRAELTEILDGPVAILSRGYGGSLAGPVLVDPNTHSADQVGDEPLMMATDGPVIVARDRAAGGQFALTLAVAGLILDDAHQNPALVKDLSIVVVDGQAGFGNGYLVPAGPLREPIKTGLARADLVITMGPVSDDGADDLTDHQGLILSADLVPASTDIKGRVLGFCGIGRPDKFDATLRDLGLDVVDMYPFPDHHPYSAKDLAKLSKMAVEYGASLVTTAKDWVKLPADFARNVHVIKVTATMQDQSALRGVLIGALDRAVLRD